MTRNDTAITELTKYLEGSGWAITKRLMKLVSLLADETDAPGLVAITLSGDVVHIKYETWRSCEYMEAQRSVTFPAWYLYATDDEITADIVAKREAAERAKEESRRAQRKAERKKLFEELKKEFEPE